MALDDDIADIEALFAEEGYFLRVTQEDHGSWSATYGPHAQAEGVGFPRGVRPVSGHTKRAAAEAAWASYVSESRGT